MCGEKTCVKWAQTRWQETTETTLLAQGFRRVPVTFADEARISFWRSTTETSLLARGFRRVAQIAG